MTLRLGLCNENLCHEKVEERPQTRGLDDEGARASFQSENRIDYSPVTDGSSDWMLTHEHFPGERPCA